MILLADPAVVDWSWYFEGGPGRYNANPSSPQGSCAEGSQNFIERQGSVEHKEGSSTIVEECRGELGDGRGDRCLSKKGNEAKTRNAPGRGGKG